MDDRMDALTWYTILISVILKQRFRYRRNDYLPSKGTTFSRNSLASCHEQVTPVLSNESSMEYLKLEETSVRQPGRRETDIYKINSRCFVLLILATFLSRNKYHSRPHVPAGL
jgi:hypothetical protein